MLNSNRIFLLLIFLKINIIYPQIFDNYLSDILEEGNYDLLDVTDYHNINLIVSTSKNIYYGIPPYQTIKTNANLINSTSIITINSNYLLAACLQDSFLGKISLSDGSFTSLLQYNDPRISLSIDIPKTSCSLSNIDNIIFIGYSKIEYFEETDETNKTNIIFKLNIENKESIIEGPYINSSSEIKYFQFPNSTILTSSSRQISCEPIKIKNDLNLGFRLVCLHEGIYEYISEDNSIWENMVFATTINSEFNDFEINMTESLIKYGDKDLGFRIYKENDTYARCMTSNSLVEIYLSITDSVVKISKSLLPDNLYKLNAEIDLISYNNKLRFSVEKTSFMGKNNIYSFQINFNYYSNYFKLYDYQEKIISKILGYYNQDKNKIICLFQTDNVIKYFIMDFKSDIFELESSLYYSSRQIGSYEKIEINLNHLVTRPALSDLGFLNVESIKYELSGENEETEILYFGIDFYETLISNNLLIPEPSLNDWKTYYLSFIEHKENEYTRIYHIDNINIKIETCEKECLNCWEGYDTCTDCEGEKYAKINDDEQWCYPSSFPVEYYIYDNKRN